MVLTATETLWLAPREFADRPKAPMPRQTVRDLLDAPRQRPRVQMASLWVGQIGNRQRRHLVRCHRRIGQRASGDRPRQVDVNRAKAASRSDKVVQVFDLTSDLWLQVMLSLEVALALNKNPAHGQFTPGVNRDLNLPIQQPSRDRVQPAASECV